MDDHHFASLLQTMIQQAGTKNASIAAAVQYDVSYVSKWLSGKMLPSEKNAEEIIDAVALCLTQSASERNRAEMLSVYNSSDAEELTDTVRTLLLDAYRADKRMAQKQTEHSEFYASMRAKQFARRMLQHPGTEMTVIADLLQLDHDARLLAAGIIDGHFVQREVNHDITCAVAFDPFSGCADDCVYDAIFLIHMLTGYSNVDFQFYSLSGASGKFMYAAKNEYGITGMLFTGSECLSVCELKEVEQINAVYRRMKMMMKQENLMFRKVTMQEMFDEQIYVRSLIAGNIRWLLGHVTEHILPEAIFEELIGSAAAQTASELRRLHILTVNSLTKQDTQIMIYDSALASIASTGEIDFFNTKVILTGAQRSAFFDSLYTLLEEEKIRLKIIYGDFSPDFQQITDPCMFLSDTSCCLRLENGRYADNLLVLQDQQVKELFDRLFTSVWSSRQDVVAGSQAEVLRCVQRYRDSAALLRKL